MRTVFIHGEIERFLDARAALIDRFTAAHPDTPSEFASLLLPVLLDDKLTRDGLLARWSGEDVERLLVEVVPRRVILTTGWSAVPDLVHQWLDFLGESELLMPGDSPLPDLHEAVDRATPAYMEAMAEPSEWGSSKFWSVTVVEHGVDPDDQEAVERFFQHVDEGLVEVDDAVLEAIEEREELEPQPQPADWLPPVTQPETGDRATEVSRTDIAFRVRTLLEWIGSGRALDPGGELSGGASEDLSAALGTEADLFQTDLLVEWARRTHLVRAAGGRLVPTRISGALLEEPVLLWDRLWDNFILLDDVFADGNEDLDQLGGGTTVFLIAVTSSLRTLYSQPGPLPLDFLVSATLGALPDDTDEPAEEEWDAVRGMLRTILAQWELMGAISSLPAEDAETIEIIDSAVPDGVTPDHTVVEMLPLGTSAARRSLQAIGDTAPLLEEVPGYPAELAVFVMARCTPEAGDRLIPAWIEARGATAASGEVAALLARVDDPIVRLGGLAFLEHAGRDGIEAARGLVNDPVAGGAVRVWLSERSEGGGEPARAGDEMLSQLDGMSIAVDDDAESFLAEFQRDSTASQIALVEEVFRARHSRRNTVLEVIATGHPDERVAKIARRSLERVGEG